MDNRFLCRAYIKSLGWLVPVSRINYDCQTIEVDLSDGNGDYAEYDFDDVVLEQCTGLTAAKSCRGDGEMERLVFEGDLFHLGDESIKYSVVWHDTGFKGKQIGSNSWVGLEHWQEWIVVLGTIHDTPGELGGEKGEV